MDYRKVIYDRLLTVAGLDATNVFSSGSKALQNAPQVRPFVVLEMGPEETALGGVASRQSAVIFVHDDNGSRVRIDSTLSLIRSALTVDPATAEGGLVNVTWLNMGGDITDDFYNTIYRTASFFVAGKVAA